MSYPNTRLTQSARLGEQIAFKLRGPKLSSMDFFRHVLKRDTYAHSWHGVKEHSLKPSDWALYHQYEYAYENYTPQQLRRQVNDLLAAQGKVHGNEDPRTD